MTEAEFEASLDRAAIIAANRDYVRSVMRPVFRIERSTGPASIGRSRFGGSPDLPPGTEWPRHVGGHYRFIAQLNFAELGAPTCGLPARGLLTLFAADDESEAVFWNDPGYVRAIFTPDPSSLERVEPPKEVDRGGSTLIRFTAGVDVPHAKEQHTDWPSAQLPSALAAWWRSDVTGGSPTGNYLLGHPGVSSLAYDPTPGPEWVSLLTFASDEDLEWWWHDGDYLHVAIERERLAVEDFSALASDAGSRPNRHHFPRPQRESSSTRPRSPACSGTSPASSLRQSTAKTWSSFGNTSSGCGWWSSMVRVA